MTIKEVMDLQERVLNLEIALEKIQKLLENIQGRWPVIEELLHQLSSGYLRDR